MGDNAAFCTFDWGQKILPQEHQETQGTYSGKRVMLVLVGSFLWKNPLSSISAAATITSTIRCPTYST